MSGPIDFNFEPFLYAHAFDDNNDWSFRSDPADKEQVAQPEVQADVSLVNGTATQINKPMARSESISVDGMTSEWQTPVITAPTVSSIIQCSYKSCKKTFKTLGGMHRHLSEKHGSLGERPAELLCPKELCEKGLSGQGFQRRYRLVNHLMSANNNRFPGQGHGMTNGEAQRLAAELSYVRAQV